MTDDPNDDPSDDLKYTFKDMQAGMREIIKWANAGADVLIEADGVIIGRVIPYVDQPEAPERWRVTIRLPHESED